MAIKHANRPLGYTGVTAKNPPNLVKYTRNPTVKDCLGFELGTIWLYPAVNILYILTNKDLGVGTWKILQTAGGGDDIKSFILDDGNTITPDITGNVTVSGGSNIETYQIGANEYGVKTPANLVVGGTVNASIINTGAVNAGLVTVGNLIGGGLVRATVTGTLAKTSGNNGEIYIGSTTGVPTWGTITPGEGISIANNANNIEISNSRGNNGEVLIGATGAAPILSTITAGKGIIITNTPGGITISATNGDNDLLVGTELENDDGPIPGSSWLDCDGSAVLQATYPELFAAIGHKYMRPSFVEQTHPFTTLPTGSTGLLCCAHNGLTGADSLWVVAGTDKNLGYSQDGITWTNVGPGFLAVRTRIISVAHNRQPGAAGLWALIHGYDKVAPYSFVIKTSPDGITWTNAYTIGRSVGAGPRTWDTKQIAHNGLAAPNGLWVSVSRMGNIPSNFCKYVTSPDGITWTERSLPVTYREYIIGIAYKNGVWVIITKSEHSRGAAFNLHNVIYTSTDGAITWEKTLDMQRKPGAVFSTFKNITVSDDIFMVAIGSVTSTADEIYISEDGFGWDTYQSPLGFERNGYPKCLAYNDDVWMAGLYTTGKVASTMDYKGDWDLSIDTTPVGGRSTIQDISSNHTPGADSKWLFVCYHSNSTHIFLGEPAINTATHFYLPNAPGKTILF